MAEPPHLPLGPSDVCDQDGHDAGAVDQGQDDGDPDEDEQRLIAGRGRVKEARQVFAAGGIVPGTLEQHVSNYRVAIRSEPPS